MSKYEANRLFVLNNPNAPRLSPELAAEIGLNESIMLMQLEFWIAVSDHEIEGKRWTYQSVTALEKVFPFWGRATINRIIHSLEEQELIIVANYNKHRYDKTRWFALNPTGLGKLKSVTLCLFQNGTGCSKMEQASSQNGTTIPETTTETTNSRGNKKKESWAWMLAVGEVCKLDVNMPTNKGKVSKYAKELRDGNYTIEQVKRFYGWHGGKSWWYLNDWRGKKGNVPKPAEIVETIARAVQDCDAMAVPTGTINGGAIPMIGGKHG